MVSRTARPWTRGMTTSPNRAAIRNPIPKYMIGSIINDASNSPLPAETMTRGPGTHQRNPRLTQTRGLRPILSKRGGASERVPARVRGKLEVPDISAEPQPDAGADWHNNNVARGKSGHAEAADEIGRSVDTGETLIDRLGGRQVIRSEEHTSELQSLRHLG